MTSTATTRNRFEKQGTGDNNNTWGSVLNSAVFDLIDSALDGMVSFTLSGSKTLTSTNYAADESRMRTVKITGGTGGTVTIPAVEKWYWVKNGASGDVVFTTGSGATATVKSGNAMAVMSDGTDVHLGLASDFGTTIPKSSGTPTDNNHLTNKNYVDTQIAAAATGTSLASGMATFLATPSSANLRGTVTDETGTGSLVFANAPTLVNPVVGTQSQGDNSTKAASTAYVDTALSGLGWTTLETEATTSGTTITFGPISGSYNEILFVLEGVSHSSGTSRAIGTRFSANGVTYATEISLFVTVAASAALYGSMSIPRYTGNAGLATFAVNDLSSGTPSMLSGGQSPLAWRCAGVSYVQFVWSGGASFDAGSITLYGRK